MAEVVAASWVRWRAERGLPPGWRFWPARISAAEWVRIHGPWKPESDGKEQEPPVDKPCTKTPSESPRENP